MSNSGRGGLFGSHFLIPEDYGGEIKVGIQAANHTTQPGAERTCHRLRRGFMPLFIPWIEEG